MELYKKIQQEMKKDDSDKHLYMASSRVRSLTNEDALDLLSEQKRWHGGGLKPEYMDLKRKLSKQVRKNKGDKKMRKEEAMKLLALIRNN